MNTTTTTAELAFRSKRDQMRLERMTNLGSRLEAHFGSDFLHQFKRSRFNSVDTNRVQRFMRWLDANNHNLFGISLNDYADTELKANSTSSKISVLGTIRGCIKRFVRDQRTLEFIADMVDLWEHKEDESQAIKIAESIQRSILNRVVKDKYVRDSVKRNKNRAVFEGVRMSQDQLIGLIESQLEKDTLAGYRNGALLVLLGGFGLRADEAINVKVEDLRYGRIHVMKGKGNKERDIPYNEGGFYYSVIQTWLEKSGITSGIILKSLNRHGKFRGDLSYNGLNNILKSKEYQVNIDGKAVLANPHDYRRTASRIWYDLGLSVLAIAHNLGHVDDNGGANVKLTTTYIGIADDQDRTIPL